MKKPRAFDEQRQRYCAVKNGDLFFVKSLDRLTVCKSVEHLRARFKGHDDFVKLSSPLNRALYVCCGKAIVVVPLNEYPLVEKESKCKSYEAS